MSGEIEDPVTLGIIGKQTGWWVTAESSKGRKEFGPYDMRKAFRIHNMLLRKFRADGRIR